MNKKFIGIEIGGTKLQFVVADLDLKNQEKTKLYIDKSQGAFGIQNHIKTVITNLLAKYPLAGIGIGFGGPVNWETGDIITSHQISGWSEFNLTQWLHNLTGVPVIMDNDANIAALGEAKHGAGKDYKRVFYITLGSGAGGGFVIDGAIYHGKYPGEAEIGHIRLEPGGPTLENTCSGWAVDHKVWKAIRREPESLLAQLAGKNTSGEARFLIEALHGNDTTAMDLINETGAALGFGLSHVAHLFHPDIIIIGGGLSFLGDFLLKPTQAALSENLMKAFLPGPEVVLSRLKEDAVPIGALQLIQQHHLSLKNQF